MRDKRGATSERGRADRPRRLIERLRRLIGRSIRRGPRESWRAVSRSLTARCLAVAGVYVAVLALAITIISLAAEYHVTYASAGVNAIEMYEDAIFNGDYDALADPAFKDCQSLVLDEDGTALYASSTEFAQAISLSELDFIGSYDQQGHYIVFEEFFDDGPRYRVMGTGIDPETGLECVTSYALLDTDLNIVEGTLFANRGRLTVHEFGLLLGIYDPDDAGLVDLKGIASDAGTVADGSATAGGTGAAETGAESVETSSAGYRISGVLTENQYVINKFIGANDAGEPRVIVFAVPTTKAGTYQRAADEAQRFWLVLIPIGGAATALMLWVEVCIIRGATRPLASAITEYGAKGHIDIERDAVATELRPVFDGFAALTEDLERSQADKQRMIADISHDIKTPLSVIRGYAQAFCDGMVPPEKERAYATALCEKAERASELVETLGSYAAMEHPEYNAQRVRLDAMALLRDACDGLEGLASQRGDTLTVELPDTPVEAVWDASLVRRMVSNLVANAVMHNEAGTHIAVRAHIEDTGEWLRLCVLDDGRGVDPELAGRVFDPFVTSNKERAVGKGAGLGLAVVQRCAALHGGTVRLVPAEAPWATCFEVRLPLE